MAARVGQLRAVSDGSIVDDEETENRKDAKVGRLVGAGVRNWTPGAG